MNEIDATPAVFDDPTMADLGAYIRENMDENCCHGLATTLRWMRARGLHPTNEIIHWLSEQNVVCDCEAITELGDPAIDRIAQQKSSR
jgi:hypothetical protein